MNSIATAFILSTMVLFSQPSLAAKTQKKDAKMMCSSEAVASSSCMIELILKDIKSNYKFPGGGGISEIKLTATNIYVVSILQEERIDKITYKFEVASKGEVRLLERVESTDSSRH